MEAIREFERETQILLQKKFGGDDDDEDGDGENDCYFSICSVFR